MMLFSKIVTPHIRLRTGVYKMFKHAFCLEERWWECCSIEKQRSIDGGIIWNMHRYAEEIKRLNRLFPQLALQLHMGIYSDQQALKITSLVWKSEMKGYYIDLYENMYCNVIYEMVERAFEDAFPQVQIQNVLQNLNESTPQENFLLFRRNILSTIPNGFVVLRPKIENIQSINGSLYREHISKTSIQNMQFVQKLQSQNYINSKFCRLYINRTQMILGLVEAYGLDSIICVGKGGLCVVLTDDGHIKTAYRKRYSRTMDLKERYEQDRVKSVLRQTDGIFVSV